LHSGEGGGIACAESPATSMTGLSSPATLATLPKIFRRRGCSRPESTFAPLPSVDGDALARSSLLLLPARNLTGDIGGLRANEEYDCLGEQSIGVFVSRATEKRPESRPGHCLWPQGRPQPLRGALNSMFRANLSAPGSFAPPAAMPARAGCSTPRARPATAIAEYYPARRLIRYFNLLSLVDNEKGSVTEWAGDGTARNVTPNARRHWRDELNNLLAP